MNGFLLDTHLWLWLQRGYVQGVSPELLGELEKHQQEARLFVSAISVLEIARLVALRRYDLGTSMEEFLSAATAEDGLKLLDLTPQVLIASTRLPGDMHRDPADRILVATAREHGLTLVTRDKLLLQYAKQGHLSARKP